jgi:hypothetical protein
MMEDYSVCEGITIAAGHPEQMLNWKTEVEIMFLC